MSDAQDDVVGRFRSGHQISGRPAALTEWRITTGDPEVASEVYDLLGGDAPQEWEARAEDNIEVFTASKEVEIILAGPKALRQRMVLWSRAGKLISDSDGETLSDGDVEAHVTSNGPAPQIEICFRLAARPDLGVFVFQTGSWSLAQQLATDQIEAKIAGARAPVAARLSLELVSFVSKNGPKAGEDVRYTRPVFSLTAWPSDR
jgi:hypothetical protein